MISERGHLVGQFGDIENGTPQFISDITIMK